MTNLVARSYEYATIIYNRQNNESIFFEGELARFAFYYFNDSQYDIPNDFFEIYNAEDKKTIIDDFSIIKESINNFLSVENTRINVNNGTTDEVNSINELIKYAQENWQPINVSIELTSHCNLRCELCYLDSFDQKGISFYELEKLANELKNSGVLFVSFTGGEIFSRKDAIDIILLYYKLGFVIEIKTNALLLNKELIEKLSKIFILDLQISIYEINDGDSNYTNSYYNFTKLKGNLTYLLEYNIPLTLSILVGKHNVDKLDFIHQNLTQLGISNIFYSPYITPNRNRQGIFKEREYRLSYIELEEKFKPFIENINGFSKVKKYRDCSSSNVICYAGRDQIAISANGNVYPCLDLNLVLGSVKDDSLEKILNKRFSILEPYKIQNMEKCIMCDIKDYCDSCIGISIIENENYKEPVSHKCDISRFYYSNTKDLAWERKSHSKKL